MDDIQFAKRMMQENSLMAQVPIGGQYAPSALSQVADNAQKNGRDLVRVRSMVGLGGTAVPNYTGF